MPLEHAAIRLVSLRLPLATQARIAEIKEAVNNEMKKTHGKIAPCHRPSQNPAAEPSAGGVPSAGLGPAAQAPRTRAISTSSGRYRFIDAPTFPFRA